MATTTHAIPSHLSFPEDEPLRLVSHRVTRYLVPLGRCLFAALFITAAPMHFSAQGVAYAAAEGVPLAKVLVPISGLLALFLVPVTLLMHDYWHVVDPAEAMVQQAMFWKNVSMLGAALVLTHFGAGPISIDALTYKARAEELGTLAPRLPVI